MPRLSHEPGDSELIRHLKHVIEHGEALGLIEIAKLIHRVKDLESAKRSAVEGLETGDVDRALKFVRAFEQRSNV